MAADFVSIEVTGLTELQALVDRAAQHLAQPGDLAEALGAVWEQQIALRFETKTDPNLRRWDDLADSTQAHYDALDTRNGKLLRRGSLLERTRQMFDSLGYVASDEGVSIGMARLTDDGDWHIPLLHETGTTRMPRRGIFLADWESGILGAGDEQALTAEVVAWMDNLFGSG